SSSASTRRGDRMRGAVRTRSVPGRGAAESMLAGRGDPAPPPRRGGNGRHVVTAETTPTPPPGAPGPGGDRGARHPRAPHPLPGLRGACGRARAALARPPGDCRAPAGTIAGVSSFQVHISDHDIVTPGDAPNVLVAMNPAALKANLQDMPPGSTLLVNEDSFEQRNLDKAGYPVNPVEDGSLSAYRIVQVPMT